MKGHTSCQTRNRVHLSSIAQGTVSLTLPYLVQSVFVFSHDDSCDQTEAAQDGFNGSQHVSTHTSVCHDWYLLVVVSIQSYSLESHSWHV